MAAWQSIANGADGLQFFRWRTSRYGQEQHWEGVLNWDGEPAASPRYAAVAALAQEFAAASPHVFGGTVRAAVAVLWSLETAWSLEEQPVTQPGLSALPQMRGFLRAFRSRGVNVDLVYIPADTGNSSSSNSSSSAIDLSPYTIVIAPSLVVVPAALAEALAAHVQRGGALFLSMRSGAKGADNAYVAATLPGLLAPLVGATTAQWDPGCSLGESGLTLGNFSVPLPPPFAASPLPISRTQGRLCECLTPALPTATAATTVLARYSSGVMAGQPAATLRQDSGSSSKAIYSGTVSDEPAFYDLLARELASGGSRGVALLETPLPEGVESSVRHLASGARAVFALNWGGAPVNVTLPDAGGCVDALGITTVSAQGVMVLAGYEVAVFACPP